MAVQQSLFENARETFDSTFTQTVLALFPDADTAVTIAAAHTQVGALQESDLHSFCSEKVQHQFVLILRTLEQLTMSVSPSVGLQNGGGSLRSACHRMQYLSRCQSTDLGMARSTSLWLGRPPWSICTAVPNQLLQPVVQSIGSSQHVLYTSLRICKPPVHMGTHNLAAVVLLVL